MYTHEKVVLEWSHVKRHEDWRDSYFGPDSERWSLASKVLRQNGFLRIASRSQEMQESSFLHLSILEYFAAEQSVQELLKGEERSLSSRSLSLEASFLNFVADALRAGSRPSADEEAKSDGKTLEEKLLAIVKRSKTEDCALKAANALTILNYARVSFAGMDLSGIKVPGANLDHAIFEHTDLRGADLQGCSLRQACLIGTDLREANLTGVRFGEGLTLRGHE